MVISLQLIKINEKKEKKKKKKNLPANAGDARDSGSISGLERSPGGEYGKPTPVFWPG